MLPFMDNGRVFIPSPSPVSFQQPYAYAPWQPQHSQPFLFPHSQYSPARPSSAEPVHSSAFDSSTPGFHASSVQQPLPNMPGEIPPMALRQEGKGDRASRISHHLRVSSRARSTSPQSHRYIMYNIPPTQEAFAQPVPATNHACSSSASQSPNTPLYLPIAPLSLQSADGVISPRPIHSPNHTVTVDPFTNAIVNKCDDVDLLERVAAETVRANADMSASVPDFTLAVDKTLPRPPVPSSKNKPAKDNNRPKANALFSPSFADDQDMTPPTPTLAAFSSPKALRAALGSMGGLDALEAKLLAEVGTRKEPQDKRPDVRTIMPITIPHPNAVPDQAVDSAISSLSLPGIGGEEGTLKLDAEGIYDREASEKNTYESPKPSKRHAVQDSYEIPVVKDRSRKKSTPKPRVAEEVREKEQHRLRKAAQGRVTAWLGSIEPDYPPQVPSSPKESPTSAQIELEFDPAPIEMFVAAASEPSQEATIVKSSANEPGAVAVLPAPDERQDDKPDPRSSGFIPLGTLRKLHLRAVAGEIDAPLPSKAKGKSLADIFPLQAHQDPEVRYDVRSARGGKGGIVTAVASIWASQTNTHSQAEKTPGQPRAPSTQPIFAPSPLKNKPVTHLAPPKATSPPFARIQQSRPLLQKTNISESPSTPTPTRTSPPAELAARRTKMVKSSSVPAVVSSSLATPMLSSTASLARPKPTLHNMQLKTKLPPTISETSSSVGEAKPTALSKQQNELAFGRARLRELIQKYQS
jgi:hypothetical protein